MAHLTEKRLKEIEEEMSRFEEEILTEKGIAPRGAMGRNAQAGPMQPPPPPPQFTPRTSFPPNLRPPTAFVPHQLQHRPGGPPPPPPRPPIMPSGNMPRLPGMMPPPLPNPNLLGRPPMLHRNFIPPPPMPINMGNGAPPFPFSPASMQQTSTNQTVEKPRVVYAAAPVKRVISDGSRKAEKVVEAEVKPPEAKKPCLDSAAKKHIVPGIELNVPVEEIEAEKKLNYHAPVVSATASAEPERETTTQEGSKKKEKKRKFMRMAASSVWEDQTLSEWEQDDFRLFCGDLGNEVTDETLSRAFSRYESFLKAKVIRDKRTNKTKGFGFVSFKDPTDFVNAMREMNGKYVGNRPIKLRKSSWRDRQIDVVKKKDKEKKRLGFR